MGILNIQTSVSEVLKEYKKSEARLRSVKKLNSELYDKAISFIEKMITAHAKVYREKMDSAVEAEYDKITNQNGLFSVQKNQFSITDIDAAASAVNPYISKLYQIMAEKEFHKLLWQKLTAKEKELVAKFESLEKSFID
jgi:hypothetical protein